MKKAILSVLASLIVAPAAFAGLADTLPQDNAGFDRFTLADPFLPVGTWSGVVSGNTGWRDNIPANGDNWLGSNQPHFVKVNDALTAPTTADEGFAGVYRGSSGDTAELYYDFTATGAITQLDYAAACTVIRANDRSSRLQISVIVNGSTVATDYTPYFNSQVGVDTASVIYVGNSVWPNSAFGGYGAIGAIHNGSITGLAIAAGDTVKIKVRMPQNQAGGGLSGSRSKNLGLGIMLPEPATMSLLGVGALALLRRKK